MGLNEFLGAMQGHRRGGLLILILVLALIGLGVWLFVRSRNNKRDSDPSGRARVILSERYAKGEITKEEYQERRRELDG